MLNRLSEIPKWANKYRQATQPIAADAEEKSIEEICDRWIYHTSMMPLKEAVLNAMKEYASQPKGAGVWVNVKDKMPEHSTVFPKKAVYVLIHIDYSAWGRNEQRIEKASVHYSETGQGYGGPNSLTGSGILKGTYFAIPAILNPDCVTHWMPLPSLPSQEGQ